MRKRQKRKIRRKRKKRKEGRRKKRVEGKKKGGEEKAISMTSKSTELLIPNLLFSGDGLSIPL